MSKNYGKWVIVGGVAVVVMVAAYVWLRPKFLPITSVVPARAMAYARVERLEEIIRDLRSSKFFSQLLNINMSGLMEQEGFSPEKIEEYKLTRKSIKEMIDSPFFKQFLSREVAVALYPALDGFSNGDWPVNFSGLLVVVRPDQGAQVTQLLGGVWNQFSKEWETSSKRYQKVTVTSIKLKNSGVTIFYMRVNDLLVLSVDERVLRRVIDSMNMRDGSLKNDPNYTALADRFYDASDGEIVLDMTALKEYLKKYWLAMLQEKIETDEHSDRDDVAVQEHLDSLFAGFDGIQTAGGTLKVDMPLRFKWLVHFDASKSSPALKRLNHCVSINNPTIQLIPKDVMIYQWNSCLDFTELYEDLKIRLQQSAGSPAAVKNPLEGLEHTWGLTMEDDILPVLGRGFAWIFQGVDTRGLFPVPKLAMILKVKDEQGVDQILRKIATTPLTIMQKEEYRNVTVNFVSVPLINILKPSYAFIDGFLVIATTDQLVKQSIDASQDPLLGLSQDADFKQGANERSAADQMISFVKTQEASKQSKVLIEWTDQWFNRKIQQAQEDKQKAQKKWQSLNASIEEKKQGLFAAAQRLEVLRKQKLSLEAQVQASAVSLESQNTLSQEGAVENSNVPEEVRPEKLLELKKSQVSALELEVSGLKQEIETAQAQQPALIDDQNDQEVQEAEASKYRYYVDEVIEPFLSAVESLKSQRVTTQIKDGMIDSEMIVVAQ